MERSGAGKLNWSDPEAVRRWLDGVRSAFEDYDEAVDDMQRPKRERQLGPAMHRQKVREARGAIRQALDYADPFKEPRLEVSKSDDAAAPASE